MSDLVSMLLLLATFAFIGYPLVLRRTAKISTKEDGYLTELLSKRDITYSMIKELEFDRNAGLLSDEDYKHLESRYKSKAVSILKNMDEEQETVVDLHARIEQEVQQMRHKSTAGKYTTPKTNRNGLSSEIEKEISQLRRVKTPAVALSNKVSGGVQPAIRGPFCTQCGGRSREGDRFCAQCGGKLE
ncbi:MAG: hypothetical protein Q8O43_10405 [Dehalococcoidia bacterium]|nr:hypothetical protein [Dehalococcoidia bacterium]